MRQGPLREHEVDRRVDVTEPSASAFLPMLLLGPVLLGPVLLGPVLWGRVEAGRLAASCGEGLAHSAA